MKHQYQSNEPLSLNFPAFFDQANHVYVASGSDNVQYTVKKPDGTTTTINPTWDSDVKFWKAQVDVVDFQEGLWLIMATSDAPGTFRQFRALVWGDYTDDISEARQAALGRWKIEGTQLKIYEDDGVTVFKTFDLLDKAGNPSISEVFERNPV